MNVFRARIGRCAWLYYVSFIVDEFAIYAFIRISLTVNGNNIMSVIISCSKSTPSPAIKMLLVFCKFYQ